MDTIATGDVVARVITLAFAVPSLVFILYIIYKDYRDWRQYVMIIFWLLVLIAFLIERLVDHYIFPTHLLTGNQVHAVSIFIRLVAVIFVFLNTGTVLYGEHKYRFSNRKRK